MQTFKKALAAALVPAAAFTVFITSAAPVRAQTYNYGSYGVAHVSVAGGNVVVVRGDSGVQTAATTNAPLVAGDYLATGSGSEAEVQFDGTSMLRLAPSTQVRFVNLSPGSREVQLAAGTVDLAQLQNSGQTPQLDTPSLSVRPNQAGDYRVTVLGNSETLVTVRSGAATISSANGSQTLTPGSTLVANGSSISSQAPVAFDSFDQFNISRDRAMQTAYNANPYIAPGLAGYSNLSNYGQWQNVPGYGYAWAPFNQARSNFAPYQNGQWVWEPGYGYVWVDNTPYGYPTTHYGSWFYNQGYGGWLWQPPAYQYQTSPTSLGSAWLPAAVAFFLSGNNGGSLGNLASLLGNFSGLFGQSAMGDIGWIPLAPGEPYYPWYGSNYAYPSPALTNVPNVTTIYNVYSNAQYYRGVTMVPVTAWRTGNFRHVIVVQPRRIRQIVLIRGAVPIVPSTQNLFYSRTTVVRHPIAISRTFSAPRLAAKAPAVSHVSFKTQQARVQSVVHARPALVALPPRHTGAARPVYHPAKHAAVHVTAFRPPAHHATAAKRTHHTTAPAKPQTHRAPAPVKPQVHHVVPAPKPVRTEPLPVKPVEHPAPAPRPAAPKPAPKPVVAPKPVPKPVVAPKPAPVHPKAAATSHPKPKATPGM